jgi:hypothetical protein
LLGYEISKWSPRYDPALTNCFNWLLIPILANLGHCMKKQLLRVPRPREDNPTIVSRVLGSITSPPTSSSVHLQTFSGSRPESLIICACEKKSAALEVIHSCVWPCFGGKVEVQYQAGSRDCHAMCLMCATTRE